ncbi:Glycogen debranching enzyme [Thelohanellus kitauei]|uniref:Glycogen debranching enzyme n=1 Tax=Thelohanellus kitauei TaxID=669202 RepID=A0A0C2M3A6_THEKT|nr:Glycogen debranching enzyme [Thelohanellus kitauei]
MIKFFLLNFKIYIDQLTPTIVSVTRFNPEKAESYVMISNHVFYHTEQNLLKISSVDQAIDKPCGTDWQYPAVYIPGLIEEIFLEAFMYQIDGEDVTQNNSFICGSRSYKVKMNRHLKINDSKMVTHSIINEHDITNMKTQIGLSNFPPGSIIIFKITLHETHKNNIKNIRYLTYDDLFPHKICQTLQI